MTAIPAPTHTANWTTTAFTVAGRTTRKLLRTPQVFGIAVVQSIVFLLMFRYILGGAIGVSGVTYVEFLVPGFVVSGLLFTGGGGSVAVAEEVASGLYDRMRSLPIADSAVLAGRAMADAALMVLVGLVTLGVGFIIGFRMNTTVADFVFAIVLLVGYALAFAFVFVWLGLVSGNAQAAQGLSILAVPFSFISSAFVPIATMPGRDPGLRQGATTHVHGQLVAGLAPGRRHHAQLRSRSVVLRHRLGALGRRDRARLHAIGNALLPQALRRSARLVGVSTRRAFRGGRLPHPGFDAGRR